MITYINPVVAIVLGVIVLNEPLTIGMAIGFPMVIVGSIMGTARAKHAHAPGAPVDRDQAPPPDAKSDRRMEVRA